MSQYGGPGRPSGSGEYGSGSGDRGDDDRYTSPFGEPGGQDPHDSDRPPFGYQAEERYWTDYLRIAAPVVGVILMLGLVWFWVANMLSNDDNDVAMNNNDDDLAGPVIDAETPTPIATEDDEQAPIAVTTPEAEDNATTEDTNGEDTAPTTIGPGATVVVVGTGESGLNVRAEPSTDAEVLESVADGTALTVTGESTEADDYTWWPVDTGTVTGFVVQDFIQLSE